jgi:hypothetical protein
VLTDAERAFAALSRPEREQLLRRLFDVLEFGEDGKPGGEWSSDTTQSLGELFREFGVDFTNPDSVLRCRACARWITKRGDEYVDREGSSTCADHAEGCGACEDGEPHPHEPEARAKR